MKKLITLLLVLALLLPAAALADIALLLPDAYAAVAPVSLAPDGKSGLYATEDGLVVVREDSRVLPVTISQTRGVADTNRNLERIAGMGLRAIGPEGLVWSPDGRYAALVNQNQIVINMNLYYDPIILDMQTGELFLAATYGNKMNKENSGAMISAYFSEDSRYLYALICGMLNGQRFSLMQYDMETLEATTLYSCNKEYMHYWPHLSQLRDGSFLLLTDQMNKGDPAGINRIVPSGDLAAVTHEDFSQPSVYFYPRSLQYSKESGYALILGSSTYTASRDTMQTMHFTRLMCLRPDEGELAKDEYWEIPSLKADRVAVLRGNEAQSPSTVYLLTMCMSPDGQRALIICVQEGEYALRILNLADGSLDTVMGVDSDTLRDICMGTRTPYLDWSGNTILLGKQGGMPMAYKLY